MDVIGVGDIDIDIYLEVDHIPARDEKEMAKSVNFFPGGMVANFLVALRRLGTTCGFHGPIGSDEFGQAAQADLVSNNVDTSNIIIKNEKKTYFCVVMLDASGEKALVVAPTECLSPEENDISVEAIKSAKHLHTIFLGPAQAKAISIAHENGMTVSVDFEPDSVRNNNTIDEVLSNTDIAFINQNALGLMSNCTDISDAAHAILSRGPRIVCVTLGKRGSLIAAESRAEVLRIASFDVPVIDTTGAGDCFAAGFIHGFLNGWPLEYIGKFASATAAMKITKMGGHSGAPTLDQVRAFLEDRKIYLTSN